jgi:hypothetical protein
MASLALKIICSVAALFGAFSLVFLWFVVEQGVYSEYGASVAAVKIGGVILRSVCLILCAWAAWRRPQFVAWLAWGALISFVIGGYVGSSGHLLPIYYVVVAIHVAFVIVARALVNRMPLPIGG